MWSTIRVLYFLLDIFTAVFSLFLPPPIPLLSLYPFLTLATEYSVYTLYSFLYMLFGWFFTQLAYPSKCQQFFPTTQKFRKAVMFSPAVRTVYDYLRPKTIPFGEHGVSASEHIRIYAVSLLSCPRTRILSRDVSADADFLRDKTVDLMDTIK